MSERLADMRPAAATDKINNTLLLLVLADAHAAAAKNAQIQVTVDEWI